MKQSWILLSGAVFLFAGQGCGEDSVTRPAENNSGAATKPVSPAPISTFKSHGQDIPIERFEPASGSKHPAVILLHGAYGPERDGAILRSLGKLLAEHGYLALIPHYFERTSTKAEDLVNDKGVKPEGSRLMDRHMSDWLGTVRDAVDFAVSSRDVDAKRIGLLGFSLGASLAASEAAHDPRIRAVVDYVGGQPFDETEKVMAMPPVLILQGDSDTLVPVMWSKRFQKLLIDGGFHCEMHLYAGQDHYFGKSELKDAEHRSLSFFDKHLK